MSLSPQNVSNQPAVIPTKHSSNIPTPDLLPSAPPNDNSTSSKTPTKHRTDGSTTSNSQFAPFFTLVEDIHTTQHHHPTVHYIFSDDSTDIITEAALRTLEPPSPSSSITPSHHHSHNNSGAIENNTNSTTDNDSTDPSPLPLLPPPRPGITDRYILLDLSLPPSPSSNAVPSAHAHSLTPDWQVLNVEVSRAPTWDADPDPQGAGGAERNRPLMLKIQGTEGVKGGLELGTVDGNGERGGGEGEVDMEGLVGLFEKRMAELRRLIDVEAGGGGVDGDGAR